MATFGKWYLSALKGAIALLFAALVVAAFYQVFSRYILGITPAWTEEAARYLAIWVVMLTSALAIDAKAHIAVDLIPNALPRQLRVPLVTLSWLCVLAFLVVLIQQGWNLMLLARGQVTPGLGIPMVYVYIILPVSGVCMLFSSIRSAWSFVQGEIRGVPQVTHEENPL